MDKIKIGKIICGVVTLLGTAGSMILSDKENKLYLEKLVAKK